MSQCYAEVLSHTQVHERLWELQLIAQSGPVFQAGQYVSFLVDGKRHGPYSIASAPSALPVMTFYSRHPFTPSQPLSTLELTGVKGEMTAPDREAKYVFCAGGTGVTPFLSLRNALREQGRESLLLWSMTDLADRLMAPQEDRGLVVHDYLNDPPYTELLKPYLSDFRYHFYVAGPMPFVRMVGQWLLSQQVDASRILSDMLDVKKLAASASPLES